DQMNDGLAATVRVTRKIWLYDYQYDELMQTTGLPVYDPNEPQKIPEINPLRPSQLVNGQWLYITGGLERKAVYPGITMMHAILIPKTNKVLIWGYINDLPPHEQQRLAKILDVDSLTVYSLTGNQPWEKVPQSTDI